MKILQTIDVFSFEPISGAGKLMFEAAREYVKAGHEVHIIARGREGVPEEGVVDGVHLHTYRVDEGNHFQQFTNSHKKGMALFEKLSNEISFDILNSHHPLLAYFIKKHPVGVKIPLVYTFHSPWPDEYLWRRIPMNQKSPSLWQRVNAAIRARYERKALTFADKIICMSDFMKSRIVTKDASLRPRIHVVPGGTDTSRFCSADGSKDKVRDRLGLPKDKPVLFTLRYLSPRMGITTYLSAIQKIVQEYPDIRFVIGGAGPSLELLRKQVRDWMLDQYVDMPGFVPEDKLVEYYQAADLFILPTEALEGFGVITIESMSCGTLVFGTPVGGTVEILKKFEPNCLFAGTDENMLAEKIKDYLKLPSRWNEARSRCRDFIKKHYCWSVITPCLLKVFKSAANKELIRENYH